MSLCKEIVVLTDEKERIINEILDLETEMFISIKSREPSSCRENLQAFENHRKAQFSVWSLATCKSYLHDLQHARESGVNLLTIKYARMEQIIPPYSSNPHIDRIVDVFVRWQEEVQRQYPMVMRGSRTIKDFRNYLRSELETYSDNTISLLAKDVALYEALGKNMSLVLYQHLAELGGYSSLERMEQGLVTRIT
jgi:hypothetical protein